MDHFGVQGVCDDPNNLTEQQFSGSSGIRASFNAEEWGYCLCGIKYGFEKYRALFGNLGAVFRQLGEHFSSAEQFLNFITALGTEIRTKVSSYDQVPYLEKQALICALGVEFVAPIGAVKLIKQTSRAVRASRILTSTSRNTPIVGGVADDFVSAGANSVDDFANAGVNSADEFASATSTVDDTLAAGGTGAELGAESVAVTGTSGLLIAEISLRKVLDSVLGTYGMESYILTQRLVKVDKIVPFNWGATNGGIEAVAESIKTAFPSYNISVKGHFSFFSESAGMGGRKLLRLSIEFLD